MTSDRLNWLRFAVVILGVVLAIGCDSGRDSAASEGYRRLEGYAMGTTWSVQFRANGQELEELHREINELLARLESDLSTWRDDSKISRFNATESTDWFPVSSEFVEIIVAARIVNRLSEGAFDPSVYPLVQLWGFGPGERPEDEPTEKQVEDCLATVGFHQLEARETDPALRKNHPHLEIDLSALAKGFAVDQVSELLETLNLTDHLVEFGGELYGMGLSSKGRPWRVGIELPLVGESEIGERVELSGRALATSGDYRNFLEIDGERFSHVIDPRTGRPLPQRGLAVSVMADSCMDADAWATALTLLGVDAGLPLAEKIGIAAHFTRIVDGNMTGASTSHWKGVN